MAALKETRFKVVVVNSTARLAPWANMLYACDYAWWAAHDGMKAFSGERWTQCDKAAKEFGLNYVNGINGVGFSTSPAYIANGANSGFQALNLVSLMGAARVILLGFDMAPTNGMSHWHGDHANGLNNPRDVDFARWIDAFNRAADALSCMGVEVVNCSRESALTCFQRRSLESVI